MAADEGGRVIERPEFAVVFPRASVTGGVERVALELLRFESARRPTYFVGQTLDAENLQHEQVQPRRVPKSLRPLAFRRAAAKVLSGLSPATTLSFGVNCPPGDVYWVQSVHRAWLEDGGDLVVRGVHVPSGVRKLLLRHQVLLRLEHDYFVNHRPRAILCTSQREITDLMRLYNVSPDILHVAPNGFDATQFSPLRRAQLRADARSAIGATADDIVVLMVANEWHRKGLGTLLEAVAALRDRRVRLDLVGRLAPDDYRPMAQRLGLADRMRWHGPSVDVSRFHAAADVFALPTTYEPFGMVIIESMASGLPVVTSRIAGAATAIEHGGNGLLLDDPRDTGQLAVELTRLLDPAERERMGAAAAMSVSDYEWHQIFSRVESVIFPAT
jgi:glycosyltransferase involved in cell wall biosynthesis